MKKVVFYLICFVCFITFCHAEYNYTFLRETDLLVTPDNVDELNKFYNGITVGTLLLNYDTRDDTLPINNKDLTLGTTQFGLALLSAYENTKDKVYLDRAILIGENTINNKTFNAKYASGVNDDDLTLYVSRVNMNNGEWGYDLKTVESYPLDSLFNCAFMIELSKVTNDSKYAENALKVIDSWIYIQKKFADDERKGALPYYVYYASKDVLKWGEGMWPSWDAPSDIAYSLYLSGMSAYEYTGDSKYKEFVDDYYSYLFNMFENYNGTFTWKENGISYTLPYEFIVDDLYGVNKSNYNYVNGVDTDITTDQLFYTVLGVASYDAESKYPKEFKKSIDKIMLDNGTFYGEYTIDGKKGTGLETTIEIVNTGFYLKLSRLMNEYNCSSFVDTILDARLKNNNSYALNGWAWDYSSEAFYIEALSSAVLSEELNLCYKNTIVIDDNKSNDDIISDNTDEENNPNTSTNKILMYISCFFGSIIFILFLLLFSNKIKKYKRG